MVGYRTEEIVGDCRVVFLVTDKFGVSRDEVIQPRQAKVIDVDVNAAFLSEIGQTKNIRPLCWFSGRDGTPSGLPADSERL